MNVRLCLILLGVMGMWSVGGCQKTVAKTDTGTALKEPAAKAGDTDKPPQRYTTQRRRDAETGKIETVRVPVKKPCQPQPAAAPAKPAEPAEQTFELSWQENCPVQEAYSAACWVFETHGLTNGATEQDREYMFNPHTGHSETRMVPKQGSPHWRWDELSAFVKGQSTAGIAFTVVILLLPPETSRLTITAASKTHREDILEQQAGYLRDRIRETIRQKPEPETLPYPETLVFHHPVQAVYDAIYHAWAAEHQFECGSNGRDAYYKEITCKAGSGIQFNFTLRLVGPEETRVDMKVSHYEGKEEFGMILRALMEVLEGLGEDRPQEPQAHRPDYPEMLMLNHSVHVVGDTLGAWIGQMKFDLNANTGDAFSKHLKCQTDSGIWLTFRIKQITPEESKLTIVIDRYEHKEEFPMILKSLHAVLDKLRQPQDG